MREASPSDLELLRVPVEVESPVSPPALRSRQIEARCSSIGDLAGINADFWGLM